MILEAVGTKPAARSTLASSSSCDPLLLGVRPRVPNLQSHSQEEREAEAGSAEGAGTEEDDFEAVARSARSSASNALAAAFAFF